MTDKENSRIGVNSSSIGGGIGFGQTQMSTSFSGASQSATLISGLTSNQVCKVLVGGLIKTLPSCHNELLIVEKIVNVK